jgi:hypothetical protein
MIVLLAAVVAVCVGVVVVAVGRGGQIAEFVHDAPPLGLPSRRPIAGTDVALLRLPAGPWGYSFRATDDALRRVAHALTERDTRIAVLEQQVSELRTTGAQQRAKTGESPWFDREGEFEPRPGRALPSPATDAIAAAEPESTARMLPPAPPRDDEAPQDDVPADAPQDDVPPETEPRDAPQDDAPVKAEPQDDAPVKAAPQDDVPQDDVQQDDAPQDDLPQEDAAQDDVPAEVPASAGATAVIATPAPAEPAAEPESGAVPDTAVDADDDWAFEDDVEPVVEPLADTSEPEADGEAGTTGRPVRPRKRVPAPSPGDRLVASNRPRADDETGGDTPGGPHAEGD